MTSSADITFVLTSCGRFDLLAATIASFLEFNTAPIARYVVVEDSGDEAVRDVLATFESEFEVLVNPSRRGQMKSIERAYASVGTPYIFHCEDDWRFFRSGFIEDSIVLLERFADISAVNCRRLGQNPLHDMIVLSAAVSTFRDIEYRQPAIGAHELWGGYSFNPGLRRTADSRRFDAFGSCGHELEASLWFKRAGMGIAALEDPACETTGRARHLEDPYARRDWSALIPRRPASGAYGPVARNAPCPCGSGRRYKHCHGAAK